MSLKSEKLGPKIDNFDQNNQIRQNEIYSHLRINGVNHANQRSRELLVLRSLLCSCGSQIGGLWNVYRPLENSENRVATNYSAHKNFGCYCCWLVPKSILARPKYR